MIFHQRRALGAIQPRFSAGAGPYVGPADIQSSGWFAWYGMRAFSSAIAATPAAAIVVIFGDFSTKTYNTNAGGIGINLSASVESPFNSFATDLGLHGGPTELYIWKDQSGGGNDLNTAPPRPAFTSSAFGAFPTIGFSGQTATTSGTFTTSVPAFSLVVRVSSAGSTQQQFVKTILGFEIGRYAVPPTKWYTYGAGPASEDNTPVADDVFHAAQFLMNGTSSNTSVDGVDSLNGANIGTVGFSAETLSVGGVSGTFLTGDLVELGFHSSAVTLAAVRAALNTNQHGLNGYNF